MIRRDIEPQWQTIVEWYWAQYQDGQPNNTIWQVLEREHGAERTRPLGRPGWSVMEFPDEQAYAFFLLRWS